MLSLSLMMMMMMMMVVVVVVVMMMLMMMTMINKLCTRLTPSMHSLSSNTILL